MAGFRKDAFAYIKYATAYIVKLDAAASKWQASCMEKAESSLTEIHVTAWARLVRSSERILIAVDTALKTAELPPLAWYDLLLELKRAGSEGLRPYQLQTEMLIPQYNLSRLTDRVAKAGYIERAPCDDDRRGQVIRITQAGLALQRKMWPVYRGVLEREFAARLSSREAGQLAKLLALVSHDDEER